MSQTQRVVPAGIKVDAPTNRLVANPTSGTVRPSGQQQRFFRQPAIVPALGQDTRPAGRGRSRRTKKNKRKTLRRK